MNIHPATKIVTAATRTTAATTGAATAATTAATAPATNKQHIYIINISICLTKTHIIQSPEIAYTTS